MKGLFKGLKFTSVTSKERKRAEPCCRVDKHGESAYLNRAAMDELSFICNSKFRLELLFNEEKKAIAIKPIETSSQKHSAARIMNKAFFATYTKPNQIIELKPYNGMLCAFLEG